MPQQNAAPQAERIAIVDIGSNSVRLVVYESVSRTPATVHNEKAICAIGRNMVTTGRLSADGIIMALQALRRFRLIADALKVPRRDAVATAAARDASNGQEFIRAAEAAWGAPIQILSGEEEAHLAAQGVLAGIPQADGLAADLGGGSLDVVTIKNGHTGHALTLPYGPLRLMDVARGDPEAARKFVDDGLAKITRLGALDGRSLYAVGGIWRSLARLDMEDSHYPLHVLQQYVIPRSRALRLCKIVAQQSRKSLERVKVVSKRRAESLPYGAVVLERLLSFGGFKDVVISAFGLREGLLHAQLPEAERAKDPLIEYAAAANIRMSRAPAHATEMFDWMAPIFADADGELSRLRHAVCLFSDVGWRRHPDDRAIGAFNQVLTAPFSGADHRTRALIATAVYHRYSGDEDFPRDLIAAGLLDPQDERRAVCLGLAARLAFTLSGSALGELQHYKLRMTPGKITLEAEGSRKAMLVDPAQKRLSSLAEALGRKGETLTG